MLRGLVFGLCAFGVAGGANAAAVNLLANGDFENGPAVVGSVNGNSFGAMNGASGNNSWDVWSDIPGWATTGNGVEIQTKKTISGANAQSGNYYVELDSHPKSGTSNSGIVQTLTLDPGKYRLSYWYQPRTNSLNDNMMEVLWDSGIVASHNEKSSTHGDWVEYTTAIHVAAAGDYDLMFRAAGLGGDTGNTLGALLDNVALMQTPIPPAFVLMGAALGGLAFWRRRTQKAA